MTRGGGSIQTMKLCLCEGVQRSKEHFTWNMNYHIYDSALNDAMMYTWLCTIVLHNTAQNSSDNLPSYPADNHHSSDVV